MSLTVRPGVIERLTRTKVARFIMHSRNISEISQEIFFTLNASKRSCALQKSQKRTLNNVYIPSYEVLVQTTVKSFFTADADKLVGYIFDKLADCQSLTHGRFCCLIKSQIFTGSIDCFVKRQAEIAVAGEAKL